MSRLKLFAFIASAALVASFGTATAAELSIKPNPICTTGAQGRPTLLGVSGGNINSIDSSGCCTGTIGSLVQDSKGRKYILSNNHVIARTSSSRAHAAGGETIIQPGLADTACFKDRTKRVGRLSTWIPLFFGLKKFNQMDAAIAKVDPDMVDPIGQILNIGPISATPFPLSSLSIGMYVQKMGRTSCLTEGQINALDASGRVSYARGCHALNTGTAVFIHQILVQGNFGQSGDSGSLVLSEETCPRAIGLLFGGTSGFTVVNPIERVLKKLKVSMTGGCSSAAEGALMDSNTIGDGASAAFRTSVEAARQVKDRHQDELLGLDEVQAVGIGAGADPDHAALVIFVKKDTAQVRSRFAAELDGTPVRIVESGEFVAL